MFRNVEWVQVQGLTWTCLVHMLPLLNESTLRYQYGSIHLHDRACEGFKKWGWEQMVHLHASKLVCKGLLDSFIIIKCSDYAFQHEFLGVKLFYYSFDRLSGSVYIFEKLSIRKDFCTINCLVLRENEASDGWRSYLYIWCRLGVR